MQEDYERQLTFSEEAKEQAVSETTEYYEGQKAELEARLKQIEEEKEYLQREHKETQRQIEEDADQEILDVKNKYERRLRDEVEANMRLKGETGIMKKKFATLERERKEQKEEIQRLHGEENKLRSVIRSLEKDAVTYLIVYNSRFSQDIVQSWDFGGLLSV
ncbi:cilia- and flagella-associated protein 57-like [Oscarella lobularis]|uniref:cilia- and flagella-associated protein 57-like n=1 Tax=Oscarella lobularis TaxID=121494 RepID=UPI003313CF07